MQRIIIILMPIEPETLQVLLTKSLCCHDLPLELKFMKRTITGRTYLDMLENWLMPQINEDSDDYVFQQDGCPAHFHNDYLNTNLPQLLIGRFEQEDFALMRWPPRSPVLTSCDFSCGDL